MIRKRLFAFGNCAVLLLMLTGCGFHLKGTLLVPATIQPIYIQADNDNSMFIQTIRNDLSSNNITLTDQPDAAKTTLYIGKVEHSTHLISLRGGSQAGQYQVTGQVQFYLDDAQGKPIIAKNTVTSSQSYSSNATQTLSAQYTSQDLGRQMQQDLADQILMQLASVKTDQS